MAKGLRVWPGEVVRTSPIWLRPDGGQPRKVFEIFVEYERGGEEHLACFRREADGVLKPGTKVRVRRSAGSRELELLRNPEDEDVVIPWWPPPDLWGGIKFMVGVMLLALLMGGAIYFGVYRKKDEILTPPAYPSSTTEVTTPPSGAPPSINTQITTPALSPRAS